MTPRWRLCPDCAAVGNHGCTLCGGNGGWYISPFRAEPKTVQAGSVESFITARVTPPAFRGLPDGEIVTETSISDKLCGELLEELDSGDYQLTDWDIEFIGNCLGRSSFSPKQKAVIYKLSRKLKLL